MLRYVGIGIAVGIGLNAIAPGLTDTAIAQSPIPTVPDQTVPDPTVPDLIDSATEELPPALPSDLNQAAPSTAPVLFTNVEQHSITIAGDPTDIYIPINPESDFGSAAETEMAIPLPIALLLPGAMVDPDQYSEFASQVAKYGFVVVVPSNVRSLPEFGFEGELAEAAQITNVLNDMAAAQTDPDSPLAGRLIPDKMALLGHSHGGAVGLMAIGDVCMIPFCMGEFQRPDAVMAGAFYGVNTFNPETGEFGAIDNDSIPVALIQGGAEGVSTPDEGIATYEQIADAPKVLVTVDGANHYGITNDNNPTGSQPDESAPTVSQAESISAIADWTGLFLRAHLWNDQAAFDYIYDMGDAQDDRVEVLANPGETQ